MGSNLDVSRLYTEMRASLMRYTSRYFRRSQEVEDVVQEAFVKVIEAQRKREIRTPEAYLVRTARNLSLKQVQKPEFKLTDAADNLLSDSDIFSTQTMEEQLEGRENFEMFCRAVRALPVKCRRAFVLGRVYGFSQKEIAEHMGISLKAVEGHLARATRRCADFIEAEQSSQSSSSNAGRRKHYHG